MAITDVYHNDEGDLSKEYVAVRKCWVKHFKFRGGSLEARECSANPLLRRGSHFSKLVRKEGLFKMQTAELKDLIDQVFEDFVEQSEVVRFPGETEWTLTAEVLDERRRPTPSSPPKTKRRPARRRRAVVVPAAIR